MSESVEYHDPNTQASDPGGIKLSYPRLWKLDPGGRLFAGFFWGLFGGPKRLEEQLMFGDSRAATVVSVNPLLVAAYSDEIDGIVMLNFPDRLVQEFDLNVGSRLLTVNTYSDGNTVVADLIEGENSFQRTANVCPVIADFVTDDAHRLEHN